MDRVLKTCWSSAITRHHPPSSVCRFLGPVSIRFSVSRESFNYSVKLRSILANFFVPNPPKWKCLFIFAVSMSFDKDLTFSHDRHGPSNKVITKNRYPRIRHFPTVLTNARFIIFSFPTWPAVYWNDFTFVTPSSLDGNKMVVQEFHRVECCYALVKCLNSPCQHNVSLGQTSRENNQLWNQVLRSI